MKVFAKLFRLVDLWIPRYGDARDHENTLVYRYYQFLCAIIASFFVVFSASSAYQGLYSLAIAQVVVILIIIASVEIYRKTHSLTIAANIILGFTAPVTCYRLYVLGGLDSPILFGWPVISVLALMTLPLSWTLLWTALHMAFAFFFYFMPEYALPIAADKMATVSNIRIAMICAVQFILLFSVYLIRSLNAKLRQQLHLQSEEVINVVRTISHDLSSPLMTLRYWVQNVQKKNLAPDFPAAEFLQRLQVCSERINEVKNAEAYQAGKLGKESSAEADPEVQLSRRLLRFIVTLLVSMFSVFGAYYVFSGSPTIGLLQLGVAAMSLAGYFIYQRTGSLMLAGNLMMIMGAASGIMRAKMLGGIESPAFFVWPVVPVFVGAMLPFSNAAFWAVVYAGIALSYDVAHRMGIDFVSILSVEKSQQVRMIALCIVQAIVVGTIYYMKLQNGKFRTLIETQRGRRLQLLKLLTGEVGDPLRQMQLQLQTSGNPAALEPVLRSLRACLDIVEYTERWMNSTEAEQSSIVDLRGVVDEVAFLQESALRQKNIEWKTEFKGEKAPLVRAGRSGLSYQVLNNLVSKAIKFTPEGGRVSVKVGPSEEGWSLTVEDSGIGIPETLLAKIFDPQKPTTREGTSGEKGTGFGMPIVKLFVEKFDGSIHIESRSQEKHPQGHGTSVRIELPFAPAAQI